MDKEKKAIGFLSCSCFENLVAVPREPQKLGVSSHWAPRRVFYADNLVLTTRGSVHFHTSLRLPLKLIPISYQAVGIRILPFIKQLAFPVCYLI